MNPQVSVVVPTHERPDLLDRCLEALASQAIDPTQYEVVVASDGADEATRRVVERWAERARADVRYVASPERRGPAAARNLGWRSASGEIIAFTDDDCVPVPGWLKAGLAALADGVVGAMGRTAVPLPEDPTDYELDASRLGEGLFVTANCFYRRHALEAVGGFDERFATAWREDADLQFRVERLGKLDRAPDAVVVHPVRPAPWGISLKQQRKAMYNALLYRKHPDRYWQCIQPSPPWHYYGTVIASLLALGLAATRRKAPATAAAAAWAALTVRFFLRRLRGTSRRPSHVAEMAVTSAVIPFLSVFWRLYGAIKYRVLFL